MMQLRMGLLVQLVEQPTDAGPFIKQPAPMRHTPKANSIQKGMDASEMISIGLFLKKLLAI